MSRVQLMGSLPGLIRENTFLWDWVGQLRLTINPASIRFVDVIGFGENFFEVAMDRRTGMLTISPTSMADHEWFVANNISTDISFSLRFFMTDGSVMESQATYSVTLLNEDDTPPQALSWASGGTVIAGQAGATIGRLAVSDPDTASGFTFTIREDDQWIFEVVGNTLRLKAGVSIPLADGPERDVVITVSDGLQSSALTLSIGITVPGVNNGGTVDIMETHESEAGFRWASQNNLFSMRMSYELSSIRDFGTLIHIQMRDGGSIMVQQPAVIDLLDGYITFSGTGFAARAWTIYETILNRDPRHGEMAAAVARLAGGTTQETLAAELLASAEFTASFGSLSNAGFAERLYRNSVGWTDQNGMNWHTSRLDNGVTRAKVADGFITWRIDSLRHADQRAENGGFFVPRAWVDVLDDVQPARLDSRSQTLWLADQIISGTIDLSLLSPEFLRAQGLLPQLGAATPSQLDQVFAGLPPEFMRAQGLLPQFGTGTPIQLERLFADMVGAPAESNWTRSFTESIQKQGMSSSVYLQELVRELDLAASHANLNPAGIAFQAGW